MKTVKIRDLGRTVTGHTPPTSESKYFGDYMPFVKPTDISKDSKYTYNPEQYYSEEAAEKYKTSMIPKGSTCVVCIGTIGEKMTMAHCDMFTNQSINTIVPSEDYDPDYVYYLLKYNLGKVKALNKGTASGREYVSKSTFLDMDVEVVEEKKSQVLIGKALSAYDELIESNCKRIELIREACDRLYKEWFIDLRFPGYQNVVFENSIPANWTECAIGDRFDTLLGGTPSREKIDFWKDGNIPWINSGAVNNFRIIKPSELITQLALEKSATKLLPVHSTLVAITGATMGQVSYTEIPTCANQSVVAIVDKSEKLSEYLYMYICSTIGHIINKATGGAQQHINKEIVNKHRIIIPDDITAASFKNIITPYNEELKSLLLENEFLSEAREKLMPSLLAGTISTSLI